MTKTYNESVQDIINELQTQKNNGADITATICVGQLDPEQSNSKMRKFATDTLGIEKRDFDRELAKKRIAGKLGSFPETAGEFIEIVTSRRQTNIKYNGVTSEPDDGFVDFSYVMKKLREEAAVLKLPFARESINDSAEIWFIERKAERLPMLRDHVKFNPDVRQAGTKALRKIAESCFNDEVDLVVAAIQKFIHQVKGKMSGLAIERHLMMVLLGRQGGGKSTLARFLIAVIEELCVAATLTDMGNDRVIDMWKNFIGFCDEMIGGSRADNALLKHAITAPTMPRRPLYTNLWITIPQNLTFIGTSNATEFQEIIRDETGMRRYLGLNCKDLLDWDLINSTDWLTIWQSVDETAADPMLPFREVLEVRQEQHREKSSVEVWLDQLRPNKEMCLEPGDEVTAARLHANFRAFEIERFPADKTNQNWFGRRLAAVKNSPFKHTPSSGMWRFTPIRDEDDEERQAELRQKGRLATALKKTSGFTL